MPYPPDYSQIWDITFPPDTQLANLLGQDIRDLKNEVMQRMALMSGLFSNRPTPETVNATWGGSGFGLLYFATDTAKTYQWNGAGWIDVTTGIGGGIQDYDDYAAVQFLAAAPGAIRTVNIPIGGVQAASPVGSFIEIETGFRITGATGPAPGYTMSVFGQQILNVGLSGAAGSVVVKASVMLSSLALPKAYAILQDNANTATLPAVVKTSFPGVIDGSSVVAISDAFAGSTTISAIADYMHVRVRK